MRDRILLGSPWTYRGSLCSQASLALVPVFLSWLLSVDYRYSTSPGLDSLLGNILSLLLAAVPIIKYLAVFNSLKST